jgi:hypothetical protein
MHFKMIVQKYHETKFLRELTYFYLGYLHFFYFALEFQWKTIYMNFFS